MIYRVQCTMMTTSQWRLKSLPTWLFAQQLAPQVNKTTQSSTLKRIKGSLVTNKQRAGRFISKMKMKEDYIFEILVAISILSLKWKLSINCTFHIRILKLYEILPIAGISARSLRALSNRSIWWRHNSVVQYIVSTVHGLRFVLFWHSLVKVILPIFLGIPALSLLMSHDSHDVYEATPQNMGEYTTWNN